VLEKKFLQKLNSIRIKRTYTIQREGREYIWREVIESLIEPKLLPGQVIVAVTGG